MNGMDMKGTKPKKNPLSECAKVEGLRLRGSNNIDRPIPIDAEKMVERLIRRKVVGNLKVNSSKTGARVMKEYPKFPRNRFSKKDPKPLALAISFALTSGVKSGSMNQ